MIESILFAIGESVPIDRICEALEIDRKKCRNHYGKMQSEYENDQSRGIKILRLEDSFQLCTKTEYYGYIRTVAEKKAKSACRMPRLRF
ncbi:MAG: SMC-Scp complex subunit ScpB [Clostridiales bacterium]|nr:MAG: SMC-Scp complex subunit ScpB [Clostridiales bacterium]